MNEDSLTFLHEIERRRGAPIEWRTYATWWGTNGHGGMERVWGVFLYRIGSTFWFEDFEKKYTFLGFPIKKPKNEPDYVKFEDSFDAHDVLSIKKITKRQAERIVQGTLDPARIKPAGFFKSLFNDTLSMLTLSDGNVHLFQLIDDKAFAKELERLQAEPRTAAPDEHAPLIQEKFAVLKLPPEATKSDVEHAYQELKQHLDPALMDEKVDREVREFARKRFAQITEAYEYLMAHLKD